MGAGVMGFGKGYSGLEEWSFGMAEGLSDGRPLTLPSPCRTGRGDSLDSLLRDPSTLLKQGVNERLGSTISVEERYLLSGAATG
jgi:hypothetical protein